LENLAIASRTKSSRNENSAPTATITPMKLIQLRNSESRVGDEILFSEFMGAEKSGGEKKGCRPANCHRSAHAVFSDRRIPASRQPRQLFLQGADVGDQRLDLIG
jgi:hypothetical protein